MNKLASIFAIVGVLFLSYGFLGNFSSESKDNLKQNLELETSSVMIVNLNQNSGGSGVILESSTMQTTILTNKHVCKVIEKGGYVIHKNLYTYVIQKYAKYADHDLCLVKVMANLGVSNKIASYDPLIFTESRVVGHPGLMPTVVSKGHFSYTEIITMITGVKECTDDTPDEDFILCFLFGGVPVIEKFETRMVTSHIMPGSSGSAVFNNEGEISGLVFAGRGRELTYGYIVPLSYIHDFVLNSTFKWVKPGDKLDRSTLIMDIFDDKEFRNKLKITHNDMIWRNTND